MNKRKKETTNGGGRLAQPLNTNATIVNRESDSNADQKSVDGRVLLYISKLLRLYDE
jgi:hypothetical protein